MKFELSSNYFIFIFMYSASFLWRPVLCSLASAKRILIEQRSIKRGRDVKLPTTIILDNFDQSRKKVLICIDRIEVYIEDFYS